MTGRHEDVSGRGNPPEEVAEEREKTPAGGMGPSTKELLHLLRSIEGKAQA